MNDDHISTAEAYARLCVPAGLPGDDRHALSRRRFLQAVAAGAGGLAMGGIGLPGIDDHSADAAPVGNDEGILIIIGMYGGNDSLRMVAPVGDSNYRRVRSDVYVTPEAGLDIGEGFALAPELTTVKSMWDAGNVAVVHGLGYANANLSHFTSMAYWMSGRPNGVPSSGWVGRWLDTMPADLFRATVVGHSVPLHMQGVNRRSIAVPEWGINFGGYTDPEDHPEHLRAYGALKQLRNQDPARGPWAKALGQSVSDTLAVAAEVAPVFDTALPEGISNLEQKMVVAARLINANLGFRVLDMAYGDFDNHSSEPDIHPEQMQQFDAAIAAFYAALDPVWQNRVTIMTFSEFGRTPFDNDSFGTDHGTTEDVIVIGHRVNGDHYGEPADLGTIVEDWDRLEHTTDFRRYYASMIEWLGGDTSTINAVLGTSNSTPLPGLLQTPSL